jgi:hypothetical protein
VQEGGSRTRPYGPEWGGRIAMRPVFVIVMRPVFVIVMRPLDRARIGNGEMGGSPVEEGGSRTRPYA